MSLYHKYRPTKLSEIAGNKTTVQILEKMLSGDNISQVFLLQGPTGCGKTTIARIIANKLGAKKFDLKEIDSGDFRGIDTIREIRQKSQYPPTVSKNRVWILDECHKLTNDAQNALLKILEDTPPQIYFILSTTDPHKLINPIKGRCTILQVEPLTESDMLLFLKRTAKKENEFVNRSILERVFYSSQGQPRDALQILEQIFLVAEKDRMAMALQTQESRSQMVDLCRALIKNSDWGTIRVILQGLKKENPESIRRVVLGYMQAILLKKDDKEAAIIMEEFSEPVYDTGFPGIVLACYKSIMD